jgi:hypothetical protein
MLVITGLILAACGRALRRLAREPRPDPYARRKPDVPRFSPVARAKRVSQPD